MDITLSAEELKEIEERTKKDPQVILSFFEWFNRFKKHAQDDRVAWQLALRKQEETYHKVYQRKLIEYVETVQHNYKVRLYTLKKWQAGQKFKTRSGIRVRSKIEKIIADFLFDKGIKFLYEPIVNLNGYYVLPDFYLCDYKVILEHFGLDHGAYQQAAKAKLQRYRKLNLKVICTYVSHEPDIEEILTRKLRDAGIAI